MDMHMTFRGSYHAQTHLSGMVMFHLPAPRQLQLLVGEHVEEGDEVAIVLVALKVMSISTHLTDHVLQAGVARKHAVGTLDKEGREVSPRERNSLKVLLNLKTDYNMDIIMSWLQLAA